MITAKLIRKVICVILKQLVEKIDRVRLHAGALLQTLFDDHIDKLPGFPQKSVLKKIFQLENVKVMMQKAKEKIELNFDMPLIGVFNEEKDTKIEAK